MKPRLAAEWLHSCSGCEIALLNTGADLLDLLDEFDLVHMPVLMDRKYAGPASPAGQVRLPEADIGLVSGGVANEEHLAILQEMRRRCTTLIALGTCATHGGIPAMLNEWGLSAGAAAVYSTTTTEECAVPDRELPALLERVHAVDEKVDIDLHLPGCPPHPPAIAAVLRAAARGELRETPRKSVCDACPTQRSGKGRRREVRRFLDNADYRPDEPIESMRCLLEQGLVCMGPVTAAGCAGEGIPRCIRARVPCRGCFGPVRREGNQMLDMMNALASNGSDFRSLVDRRNLLRFSGGHGRLRPRPKRS